MDDDAPADEFVASDDADSGSDTDNVEPQPVPYGEFLNLVYLPPTLKEQLQENDSSKAYALNFLALPYVVDAAPALNALLSDAQQLMYAAEEIGKSPQREFARRLLYDINDAIEAMFTLRGAPVMDVCRDLMELTMLFRDFYSEPQRLPAWVRANAQRRKDFSFRALVNKYQDDLMYLGASDPAALKREYQGHSRTLHPAMFFSRGEELTRGRLDDASEGFAIFMIASHTTEIVRHGAAAVLMFAAWLVKDNDRHAALEPIELEVMEESSAYDRWMDYWRANIKFPDDPKTDAEYDGLLDNDWPDSKSKRRSSPAGD